MINANQFKPLDYATQQITGKIQLLVADDHTLIRLGLIDMLGGYYGFPIDDAATPTEAVQMTLSNKAKYDVILMDIVFTNTAPTNVIDGVQATRHILHVCPEACILAMTGIGNELRIDEMYDAGAIGFVRKAVRPPVLIEAIVAAFDRQRFHAPPDAEVTPDPRTRQSLLSSREHQVLRLIVEGKLHPDIAARLGVSLETVRTYRKRIMEKLKVGSTAGMIRSYVE